ncbi:MAG: hypothetical protein KQJ78_16385 [Deltaproteobacteria bacterium]|nr:hypothetical protein [Deltaproteobacteria bacterium]
MSPPKKNKKESPQPLRVASLLVMDQAMLEKARAKAQQHDVPFPEFLERACRLYGKYLDKKVSVIARPV